jgi:hypothetical protein
MIDECVAPIIDLLHKIDDDLWVRIEKGEKIIAEEERKGLSADHEFVKNCRFFLSSLKVLKVQITACVAILNEEIDLMAQEGSNLVIAKRVDDKAMTLLKNCIDYCEVFIEKKASSQRPSDWKVIFGEVKKA